MRSFILLVAVFMPCFFSCAEFVDYPLEKKSVSLIGPKNDLITLDTTLTFLWEKHIDATSYRLQIAKPNFDSIEQIPVDTIVTKDFIELSVKPGTYEWRVRPENRGSVGIYTTRKFVIIENQVDEE